MSLGASALFASIADANSFDNGRQLSAWLGLVAQAGLQRAVALANKNARTVWALLAHGREFRADYAPEVSAA